MKARIAFAVCMSVLAGCAGTPSAPRINNDSAPREHFDASGVADAVPSAEPRSRYGNPASYVVFGERYHVLPDAKDFRERGIASWYGTKFHGRRTSSGEPYDMYKMTAAHKSLPLPSYLRVTNLDNHRSVIVRVNDRGPFHEGRVVDLSYAAALKLDIVATGTAPVEIVALNPADFAATSPRENSAAVPTGTVEPVAIDLPAGSLYVQLGAFAEADNAIALKGRLEVADIRPVRIEEIDEEMRPDRLYRVRIGPFAGAPAADEIALKLVAIGITDFNIISE